MFSSISKWLLLPGVVLGAMYFGSAAEAQADDFRFQIGGPRGGGFAIAVGDRYDHHSRYDRYRGYPPGYSVYRPPYYRPPVCRPPVCAPPVYRPPVRRPDCDPIYRPYPRLPYYYGR